jgi:hypothetical protein
MKTNREIQLKAQQLMALGRQYQTEYRSSTVGSPIVAAPRTLVNLPVSIPSLGRERYIEVTMAGDALAFQLREREAIAFGLNEADRDDEARVLVSGPSAYEILRTGYERAEAERLSVALEPHTVQDEDHGDSAEEGSIADVQEILETDLLSPAGQIRAKAEIEAFFEGRLERDVLISRAIERQLERDEGYCERVTERHELKMSIGEP